MKRCSKEKVREGRKNLKVEGFETENIKKARRDDGERS
jgi:hypothetical protein